VITLLIVFSFAAFLPPSSPSSSSFTLLYKLRKESRTAPPLLVGFFFFFSIPTHTTQFRRLFSFLILPFASSSPTPLSFLSFRCSVPSAGQATQQVLTFPIALLFQLQNTHAHSHQMTCFFLSVSFFILPNLIFTKNFLVAARVT
jgi:hypothetical protein